MASTNDYLVYVLDLLREVDGITYKKMMGEYILYKDGLIFGGIYDNRFLVKKVKCLDSYSFEESIPYDGAKPMYLVDMENPIELRDIIISIYNELKK